MCDQSHWGTLKSPPKDSSKISTWICIKKKKKKNYNKNNSNKPFTCCVRIDCRGQSVTRDATRGTIKVVSEKDDNGLDQAVQTVTLEKFIHII